MSQTAWIAADWGTTHLRIWGMDAGNAPLWQAQSADGMGRLDRAGFEPALQRLIAGHAPGFSGPVVACGMVGSRQGWVEAPYRAVPCTALSPDLTCTPGAMDVRVIGGLSQTAPAADVMRGEETQIAGFLALNPKFDGVLCLPGTHSKWVRISAEEVVSFQTFLTGELFALLSAQSVLRHSVDAAGTDPTPAFIDAVGDMLSRPERMAADLFTLRAASLLSDQDPAAARARLSGLLIGSELAAARPYWLGQDVAVLGAGPLARLYITALAAQGVAATQADAEAMTLKGLTAAFASQPETTS